MAKEKRSHHRKQEIDRTIRQPNRTMARPPAVFTAIHDQIMYRRAEWAPPKEQEIIVYFTEDGDNVPHR